jgi:acetolactate synthase I/II/III large subunit
MRHAGRVLIENLEAQGATTLFTVPGESFLAALDGLYDAPNLQPIVCRQEGGASMMAEAWGKLTGRPGLCFATRGPGAANAMAGLHIAQQDSTPMILLLGLPGSGHEDREAFQEIDTRRLFSSFVKWAAVVRQPERIPEYVSRAFHMALSGRPGPVVLGFPEDVLAAPIEAAVAKPINVARAAPERSCLERLGAALARAKCPLMMVGGPGWSRDIQERMQEFASRFDLPVAAAFRYQDYVDNRHPCYVGHAGIGPHPQLAAALRDADLLLVIGARLGEMTTSGYTLLEAPNPRQKLVHVHPDPDELGTVYAPDVPVASTAQEFAAAIQGLDPPRAIAWSAERTRLRAAYEETLKALPTPGAVSFPDILARLSSRLPEDAIVTNGAGNYAAFVHRYFVYKGFRTQLAPTSGSMGYGLPAAIAAKLRYPDRQVVAFAGDGCFMMTCQELATAVQHELPIIVIIANNGIYGTIRMHQEKHYPGRVIATDLRNPDFAAFARSFGAHGETIERTEGFADAFARAEASKRPAVLDLKLDPEAITPRQTLSEIRAAASAR